MIKNEYSATQNAAWTQLYTKVKKIKKGDENE